MYRLLLVDDEEIIVNGLYEILNATQHLDLDIYRAYSGSEAIEWLKRTRMDVVITDIHMPDINGIQLLKEIYHYWPHCRVIFLTGHDKFEYAYEAFQHHAVHYLLKTEDPEKVVQVLESTISDIQKETQTESLVLKAKEQINVALALFQKDYLLHLLHKNPVSYLQNQSLHELGISLNPNHPLLLLISTVDNMSERLNYMEKIQHFYAIKLLIEQEIHIQTQTASVLNNDDQLIFLLQPKQWTQLPEEAFPPLVTFLKGALESVQTTCRNTLNASVSFVLSGNCCSWETISEKYYALNELHHYRIGSDIEMFLIDSEFEHSILSLHTIPKVPELIVGSETLGLLVKNKTLDFLDLYLETGKKDLFFQVLTPFTTQMKSIRSKNNAIAVEVYYKIALTLLSYINRWQLIEKLTFLIEQRQLMRIDQFETWGEATEYLHNLSNVLFSLQTEERQNRADSAVEYVCQYIQSHLNEDLSLVRLAEQVHLNPSYLSRLFKQVKGNNISEFIENERIQKAQTLLKKEKYKIHEIAAMVGYETAASFTRFFKKSLGVSPQEYRDIQFMRYETAQVNK